MSAYSADDRDLLITTLRQPALARRYSALQWDLLLRQAVRADLVSRLAALIDADGGAALVPAGPAAHLDGARRLARTKQAEVLREVELLRASLEWLDVPLVLLKGAAYVLTGLPAAQGRLFNDIDILVPKSRIVEVEEALLRTGWATTHHSAYDQRYYRVWMHELPPMMHLRRGTQLDVHHTITPESGRWRVSGEALFATAQPLPGRRGLFVLSNADMVLHSMVHLLLNDELSHGLRDISDIDLLLRHFGAGADGAGGSAGGSAGDGASHGASHGAAEFWPRLTARASELGLQRALHHGLRCAVEAMGTPVPASTQALVRGWGPPAPLDALLHAAWRRALRSPHASAALPGAGAAMSALYLRGHWLRMPPLLLARHLSIKALGLDKEKPAVPAGTAA